ncbi:anti-sigma factor [Phytohabitans rumicis]|uniref:Regulator of SigK n=1 Tax=Phytohabitans rumicis TaxID=1076125 RepID=A0A6V8L466_9ACTN|nr:anti-sigma factor [Phytohabitans rumicis]GFJ89439.1 hypothetical protein Prum_030810 [Phytohabitans rumicis]
MTDVHALAGAYALHALTDIERAAFARHLAECESCAQEVAELQETAARLADGTWSVPPPRLRENVLAEIRRTRQVGPGRPDRDAAPTQRIWRRRTALAVAAGIVAAAAGSASFVVQEQRVRDERAVADAARAEQAQVEAVLGASDARLRSVPVTGGGQVTLVLSESRDEGVVLLSGAPSPGSDKLYQLWGITGTTPTPKGVLAAGATGGTKLIDGVRGMQTLGVTVEPSPAGSDLPTTDMVAAVTVT